MLVENTVQEWYDAKHATSSIFEIEFIIEFKDSIKTISTNYDSPIYISDYTNKENNIVKRVDKNKWDEIIEEAEDAFDTLNIAESKNNKGDTIQEWKRVFGPTFNLD